MTKTQLKEHIRKVVRQYLNEGDWWKDEAAGRGVGGGTWRDNYPRGGDDEYPQRRRSSRYGESDEERLERQAREMQDEEQKRLGLDENMSEGWDDYRYIDQGGDMGRGGSDEDHYGDALNQQRKAERQVSLWSDKLDKATTPEEEEKAKKEIAGWERKVADARKAARSLKADSGRWRGHR